MFHSNSCCCYHIWDSIKFVKKAGGKKWGVLEESIKKSDGLNDGLNREDTEFVRSNVDIKL